jgi:hypothetical protein
MWPGHLPYPNVIALHEWIRTETAWSHREWEELTVSTMKETALHLRLREQIPKLRALA